MRTMREVVEDLRRERADALLELQEFDHAMSMMLRQLMALQGAFRAVYTDMVALGQTNDGRELEALATLIERAGRVSTTAEQVAGAFEQFHSAVSAWGARATE